MKYFTIKELSESEEAKKRGIDNTPDNDAVRNLTVLVEKLLDPIRERWGKPIIVNSGYRCKRLNDALPGASKNSSHMTGCAADIRVNEKLMNARKARNRELFVMIQKMGLPFTQLIDESNYQWIHISYDMSRTKQGQVLHL